MKNKILDRFINEYIFTALWSSTDDEGNPLDTIFSVNDIDKNGLDKISRDCDLFIKECGDLLDGEDMDNIAHDFWLTRNGHGAGFWDGDYEESKGDKLTEIAKSFRECHIYIQDNNSLGVF